MPPYIEVEGARPATKGGDRPTSHVSNIKAPRRPRPNPTTKNKFCVVGGFPLSASSLEQRLGLVSLAHTGRKKPCVGVAEKALAPQERVFFGGQTKETAGGKAGVCVARIKGKQQNALSFQEMTSFLESERTLSAISGQDGRPGAKGGRVWLGAGSELGRCKGMARTAKSPSQK